LLIFSPWGSFITAKLLPWIACICMISPQTKMQGHRQRGGQWRPATPFISRLAHRLLHTSNTVFQKCGPPSAKSWRRACKNAYQICNGTFH